MPEEPANPAVAAQPLSPGAQVSKMTIVDPIKDIEETRSDAPVAPKPAPAQQEPQKKVPAKLAPIDEVVVKMRGALTEKGFTIEKQLDHPRGAAIVAKHGVDVRPKAYVNTSDGTWSKGSLVLNIYAFLNSKEHQEIHDLLKEALNLNQRQIATFTRY